MDTEQKTLDNIVTEVINDAVTEAFKSKTFNERIQEKVDETLRSALNDACRWGKVKDALKAKIEQMLVPAIEKYDLAACNVKLEAFLDELIEESAIGERRQLLKKARLLASNEGLPESVDADYLFKAYAEFVADEYDCSGRQIEDGEYLPISITMRLEHEPKTFFTSLFEYATITFEPTDEDDPNDSNAELARQIRVSRYHSDSYWKIDELHGLSITDLRHLDKFMVRMATMAQWYTHLELDGFTELDDEVEPSSKPELEYV